MRGAFGLVGLLGLLVLAACGGEAVPGPLVAEIGNAIAAVEAELGGPQQFYEVSADLKTVTVFVATEGGATPYVYTDRAVRPGELVAGAVGSTFSAESVAIDPDRIFDRVRSELDDPVIIDFAVQGGSGGSVIYDATVASDSGGRLLVLLAANGEILGVQGE